MCIPSTAPKAGAPRRLALPGAADDGGLLQRKKKTEASARRLRFLLQIRSNRRRPLEAAPVPRRAYSKPSEKIAGGSGVSTVSDTGTTTSGVTASLLVTHRLPL